MQKIYKDFSCRNFKTRFEPKSNSFADRLQFARIVNPRISNIRDSIYSMIPKYNDYIYRKAKRNIDLANVILDIVNKDIFFDASKTPNRIKFLKQYLDCEFKVIHLVKDGRGVFDSHKRNKRGISDEGAISAWKKANLLAERELKSLEKGNKYLLRYKKLVTDPESELRRLSDFIGVEYNSQCLDFRNFDHHIIGNTKMRLDTRTEIFYDEKWKQSLSPEQLKLFERLAGDMNRGYGYF